MKILVVATHHDIFTQKVGAQYRIYNLVLQLSKRGNDIIVLQPDRFKRGKQPFRCYYFKEHHLPIFKYIDWEYLPLFTDFNFNFILNIFKILKKEKLDFIQIAYPWGIISTKILTKLLGKKIFVIYDSHDIEIRLIKQFVDRVLSKQHKYMKYLLLPGLLYIFLQEKIATACADHILTVSQEDKDYFAQTYKVKSEKMTIISSGINIVDFKDLKDTDKIRTEIGITNNKTLIVFHGQFKHFPNKEAINLISDYIAPNLKDALFIVAGAHVPDFEKNNINSLGFVEDLYSLLHAVDIAIVPILSGGGTRIKILEYMNVGLPIVTTRKGIEGIDVRNYEHAIVVDGVNEEFIDAIRYLANNEDERKRIGTNSMKLVREKYDWNKIGRKVNILYNNIRNKKLGKAE